MNENDILLSLCIPTNGVTEWVVPVLDSIYASGIDDNQYEIVIEDNGSNREFEEKITEYKGIHRNISYYKSQSQGFLCQIDSFKHARGQFIKFVNHRSRFVEGALEYLLEYAGNNIGTKPVTFFSNGSVKGCTVGSFDDFVRKLLYWSSWSGGLAFWKSDIEQVISKNKYNELFPHTDMLFIRKDAKQYRIMDQTIFSDINVGHTSKGKYNLFKAFAVEYPSVINDLLREKAISASTFLRVKNSILDFIVDLYIQFIIHKEPASYTFEDYKNYLQVYYSRREFQSRLLKRITGKCIGKIAGVARKG